MTNLSCNELSVSIGGREIVHNVSLQIGSGECVGLIGPNGSGKTTLFNAINGFLSGAVGEVRLGNIDISDLPPHRRAHAGLGRVFQSSGVFRELTIRENIQVARENSSAPRSIEEVDGLLKEVGLAHRMNERAGSLSGGQLRLLEIVRCLAAGAHAILLDEPTAGVSPKMRGELQTIIKRAQSTGVTLFIIEHDMNFIFELCSRVLVMHEGSIILSGSPQEVRGNPQLAEIYFGK